MASSSIHYDWIEYTIPAVLPWEHIRELDLSPNDFSEIQGGLGYKKSLLHTYGIRIYFDGREDMGTHVRFTGNSVSWYTKHFDTFRIFKVVISSLGKFTRIDIALNLYKHSFTIEFLESKISDGLISSQWRSVTEYKQRDMQCNLTGHTLYLGSRTSNVFLRFYDKYLESKDENWKNFERLEIEYKSDSANIIGTLAHNGDDIRDLFFGTLYKYLKVFAYEQGKNKARWPPCSIYNSMYNNKRELQLTYPEVEMTLDQVKETFRRQSSSIAHVLDVCGQADYMINVMDAAENRLKSKHKRIIQRYYEENGS